eukprot:SAG22_NODE_3768_length_1537_cov_1.803199_4_plen_56_part_01
MKGQSKLNSFKLIIDKHAWTNHWNPASCQILKIIASPTSKGRSKMNSVKPLLRRLV